MSSTGIFLKRSLAAILVLAAGVFVTAALMKNKGKTDATAAGDSGRVVRYITAEKRDVPAQLRGYGNIKPATTWTAVAQVSGSVVFKYEHLDTGQPVARGTVLIRIDDSDYQLSLKQQQAAKAEAEQALAVLNLQEENLQRDQEILRQQLQIAEADLQRAQDALARQAANQKDIDARQQNVLTKRALLQTNENTLKLIPAQRAEQQAVLEAAQAAIDKAKLNIRRCTIRAPFTGRVRMVNVEADRNVRVGDELLELFSVDAAELYCQVALDDLKYWLPEELMSPLESDMLNKPWETRDGPIRGEVILAGTSQDVRWEGKLDRFLGELDPFTRMVTVVIRVDNPYENLGRAERPPLVEGMFCEGVLFGRVHENVFPLPARAVHQGRVYIMNKAGELEIRPVSLRFVQGDTAIVDKGLQEGDRVVVTDLYPAVAGMKLRGEEEIKLQVAEVQP
ncbi:MAG TPA: hypothetical protein ENJ06_04255 [Phycisphaeraceae bacterium]|nr:hypothetical protein [Phycisphaeraceae bacterium]